MAPAAVLSGSPLSLLAGLPDGIRGNRRGESAHGLGRAGCPHSDRRNLGGSNRPGPDRGTARRLGDRCLCPLDLRRRFSRKGRSCRVLDSLGAGTDCSPIPFRPARGRRDRRRILGGVGASQEQCIAHRSAGGGLASFRQERASGPRPQARTATRRWLSWPASFLSLTPVAAVNTAVSNPRELLGTTWQLGPNFYIGNGPEATGTYVAPPFVRAHPAYEAADYAMEAMRRAGRPLTPGQVSRFWLGEGLRQWASAPLDSIRLLGWKLALRPIVSRSPTTRTSSSSEIVAAPALAWGIVDFGVVFPLAVLGLARVPRTRFWWFLSLATGLGLAATALFFVVGRYRVPWVPGLALLAAAGVVDLARPVQARRLARPRLATRIAGTARSRLELASPGRPRSDPVG